MPITIVALRGVHDYTKPCFPSGFLVAAYAIARQTGIPMGTNIRVSTLFPHTHGLVATPCPLFIHCRMCIQVYCTALCARCLYVEHGALPVWRRWTPRRAPSQA